MCCVCACVRVLGCVCVRMRVRAQGVTPVALKPNSMVPGAGGGGRWSVVIGGGGVGRWSVGVVVVVGGWLGCVLNVLWLVCAHWVVVVGGSLWVGGGRWSVANVSERAPRQSIRYCVRVCACGCALDALKIHGF